MLRASCKLQVVQVGGGARGAARAGASAAPQSNQMTILSYGFRLNYYSFSSSTAFTAFRSHFRSGFWDRMTSATPPLGEAEAPPLQGTSAPLDVAQEAEAPPSSAAAPQRERLPFLSWLQPSRGTAPIFETGVEYGLSLRCDSEDVEAVTFTLFDASTYKSWCASRSAARNLHSLPRSPSLPPDLALLAAAAGGAKQS